MSDNRLLNFIDGGHVASNSRGAFLSTNPSDADDPVAHVPEGCAADVDAAVHAAHAAFDGWRSLTGMARADHLYRWSQTISAKADDLAKSMAREVGKPITEARGEAARAVAILRYYAGEAVRDIGDVIPSQLGDTLQYTLREPLGVAGLVTPWNFPVAIPLWKAAPALAFGNTVVVKAAEPSSLTSTLLAETAQAAGLPRGVFNLILGKGEIVGAALVRHPRVRIVSFTGSCTVGSDVAAAAAARNIRYQTEMGGKNAAIVMDDADLHKAAGFIVNGAVRFAGQKCTATSRAYIHERVFEPFLKLLVKQIEGLKIGPVGDQDCAIGPMIDEAPRRRIETLLSDGPCRVVVGGGVLRDEPFSRGNFMAPTIVADLPDDSPLATDELFGPVLAVFSFRDLDEAIARANGTPFGLSAALFTRDLKSAMHYVKRIDAGMVRVNGDTTGVDPHAPFGGVKGSSSGSREQGPAAREFFTETKTVQISPG